MFSVLRFPVSNMPWAHFTHCFVCGGHVRRQSGGGDVNDLAVVVVMVVVYFFVIVM